MDRWDAAGAAAAVLIVAGVWGLAGWPWACIAAGLELAGVCALRIAAKARGR